MLQTWTVWHPFSRAEAAFSVPAVPGVYEVRHSITGRIVAFGHTGNLAQALDQLRRYGGAGFFAKLFGHGLPRAADLEFRICAAANRADARAVASRLLGMRQAVWRQRLAVAGARLNG